MKDVTELDLADVLGALLKTGETPKDILNHLQCYYSEEATGNYGETPMTLAQQRADIIWKALFR